MLKLNIYQLLNSCHKTHISILYPKCCDRHKLIGAGHCDRHKLIGAGHCDRHKLIGAGHCDRHTLIGAGHCDRHKLIGAGHCDRHTLIGAGHCDRYTLIGAGHCDRHKLIGAGHCDRHKLIGAGHCDRYTMIGAGHCDRHKLIGAGHCDRHTLIGAGHCDRHTLIGAGHCDRHTLIGAGHCDRHTLIGAGHCDRYTMIGAGHCDRYTLIGAGHCDRYTLIGAGHCDRYTLIGAGHCDRHTLIGAGHCDRYTLIGAGHCDRHTLIGAGHCDRYTLIGAGHCDRYTRYFYFKACCFVGTEHQRIVDLIDKRDIVFDVFAGVGPFAIPAAKKGAMVFANDLNPNSFTAMRENVTLNKVKTPPQLYNTDGRDFIKTVVKDELMDYWRGLLQKAVVDDLPPKIHIVMNLPALALDFLDTFQCLCSDGPADLITDLLWIKHYPTIHCYCFSKSSTPSEDVKQRAEAVLGTCLPSEHHIRYVRNVAPNKEMMCVSFTLTADILFGKSLEHCNGKNFCYSNRGSIISQSTSPWVQRLFRIHQPLLTFY